jgi:nicotinamidase-related amidase
MDQLDPTRAALLALDFQNYGVHPQGYWATHGEPDWPAIARPAVDTTARVLAAARRHRVLVVHVGVAWRSGSPEMNLTAPLFARAPDRSVEGTWGSEFYEPVAPAPGELVVYKRGVSALAGTELDRLFRLKDVNTLVLTGWRPSSPWRGPPGRRSTAATACWCWRTAAPVASGRSTGSRSR